MAFKLSTGCVNGMMAREANAITLVSGTGISFGDGTGSGGRDQILDSGNGLGNYVVGRYITVMGTTSNDGTYKILSVAAGAIEVAAGSLTTESAGSTFILASCYNGGSFAELFRNCVMRIYSGPQPASADAAETGTLLVEITIGAGAFSAGSPTNGLNFDPATVAAGILSKSASETWQGTASATGTAGWFRIYGNAYVTGASTTAVRVDGQCNTSGAQLNMSSLSVTASGTVTVDSFSVTLPTAA